MPQKWTINTYFCPWNARRYLAELAPNYVRYRRSGPSAKRLCLWPFRRSSPSVSHQISLFRTYNAKIFFQYMYNAP